MKALSPFLNIHLAPARDLTLEIGLIMISPIVAAIAGVASHVLIFKHGEWHLQAPSIVRAYLGCLTGITLLAYLQGQPSFASAVASSLSAFAVYGASLYTSIVAYRAFCHPLHAFPGPPLARISKFWHTFKNLPSKNYALLDSLYSEYGVFVRTGLYRPDMLEVKIKFRLMKT